MKILVEHTFHNPYNPEKVTGGVERYCHQLWQLLREAGHKAVLAVPADTDSRFLRKNEVVPVNRLSKQGAKEIGKVASHRVWWNEIEKLSEEFDVVVTNSELSSLSILDCEKLLPKILHVNHFPFLATGCQMAFRYMLCCQGIRMNGGKVVSSGAQTRVKAQQTWEDKKNVIAEHYPDAFSRFQFDGPLHDGDIDVNILPDDLASLKNSNGKKILAVGRPESGKKLVLAAKTLVTLGDLGYDCDMYITPYGKDYQKITEITEGTSVKVHVKVPHQEIMEAYASSDYLLFPSMDETNGMTAFEAASSGCTVFYQTPEPSHFLEPSGAGIHFSSNSPKVVAEIVQQTKPRVSRQELRTFFGVNYTNEKVVSRILGWLCDS